MVDEISATPVNTPPPPPCLNHLAPGPRRLVRPLKLGPRPERGRSGFRSWLPAVPACRSCLSEYQRAKVRLNWERESARKARQLQLQAQQQQQQLAEQQQRQQQLLDAPPASPDLPEPAATTTASTVDSSTAEAGEMDTTAASRKRVRDDDPLECPRKQPTKDATAGDTPDGSPSTRDDSACVAAPPTSPLPSETTGDSVAATPAAPIRIVGGKRRRGQRKTRSKRRRKQRVFEPSTTVAPAAPRPANTTVTAPHPPPAEEDFVTVVSKAAQRRAKALAAAAIATDPAVMGTVLYRPSAPGGTFKGSPRLTLAAAFAMRPDVVAVRINHRRNIVAADASTQPCLSELLTIKELNGIPVTARVPADRRTSVGFVHGVDGEPSDKQLLEGITSTVRWLRRPGRGSTVRLQFAAANHLSASPSAGSGFEYGMPDRVPSSADNAGASGTSPRHASVSATASHAANIIRPPPSAVFAASTAEGDTQPTTPPALAVREESREVRSYAAAVKTNLPESDTTDPGLQRPIPAPRRSLLLPASSPISSPPAAPPAEPSEDPRDALITSLLAALREVGNYLPDGHPMRAVCLQAAGVQPGAPKKD
ncbi:uncharacterized protein LOC125757613 [Rhipicephalus sanguineus]|uniref:uncharacterized protein LOC125757613 n=1 Tax=Rhipicephalus sanguineus TaxID=34632 RepID=UPI0020C46029|nr:uncharacterized protein LOC125757613 [Rhipicephalus sanguineus]